MLNVVAVSPSGATAHVEADGRLRLRARDAAPRRHRPERRRQRPRQLRVPDLRRLPRRAPSTSSGSRSTTPARTSIFRRADARPDADVRQPARRAARRRLRARARRGARPRPRPRTAATRNFTIAPAFAWSRLIQVQGFGQRYVDAERRDARHGRDQRERDLALHHLHASRRRRSAHARPGLGLHGRPHRPGRLQRPTRRAASSRRRRPFQFGVCATASADPHCTFDPGTRAEGDGRDHAGRRVAGDRARLHARAGRAAGRHDPLTRQANAAAPRGSWTVPERRSRWATWQRRSILLRTWRSR